MMNTLFGAVRTVVGDNKLLDAFREAVIHNRLEEVKKAIELDGMDINVDLSVGKLGNLSNYTPAWVKGLHGENADSLQYRPIHWAARNGHLKLLQYLCRKGADVNSTNFIGNTPLHVACFYNQKEAIKILLNYKADVNTKNTGSLLAGFKENFAPIHYAALYGDTECLSLLLEAGATADMKGLYQLTPLHFAATAGDINKLNRLLSTNIDINCQDQDGRSPLHHAVLATLTPPAAIGTVLFLLGQQAAPNLVDNQGCTPLELLIKTAAEQALDITLEQLQVAEHLLVWGADEERFQSYIYETQSFNFSLELNAFLIKRCQEQRVHIISLEKAAAASARKETDIPQITLANQTASPAPNTPIQKGVPPPPPPANTQPRKKFRETTSETVVKAPISTATDDLVAALKKRLEDRRLAIAPLQETDENESSGFSDDEDTKGLQKILSPGSRK